MRGHSPKQRAKARNRRTDTPLVVACVAFVVAAVIVVVAVAAAVVVLAVFFFLAFRLLGFGCGLRVVDFEPVASWS